MQGEAPQLTTSYNGMEFSDDFVNFVNTWFVPKSKIHKFALNFNISIYFFFSLIKEESNRPKYSKLLQHPFIQNGERSPTDVAGYVIDVLETMAMYGITPYTTDQPAEIWYD